MRAEHEGGNRTFMHHCFLAVIKKIQGLVSQEARDDDRLTSQCLTYLQQCSGYRIVQSDGAILTWLEQRNSDVRLIVQP